jgi:hypothetical protein
MTEGARRPGGRPKRRARREAGLPAQATPAVGPTPVHNQKAKLASGYVWETFRKNNVMAIRHGAATKQVFGPLARQLVEALLVACPDLGDPRYAAAVTRWSEAEAQESLLMFELDKLVQTEGITPARAEQVQRSLDKVRARSARLRADLGLTPRGHLELVAGRAQAEHSIVDLNALRAKGREALARRRQLELAGRLRADGGHVRDDQEQQ